MISGIYAILNTSNDKMYVGSAVNIKKRWDDHKTRLNNNYHRNEYLQRAWNKYGNECFMFVTIEIIEDKLKLIEREQFYIDTTECFKRNIGYNLRPAADSMLGYKASPEQLLKMSNSMTGKRHSELSKLKMSLVKKGKTFTEEHKRNKSLAQIGRFVSAETRLKISLTNKGYKHTEEAKAKMTKSRLSKKRGPYKINKANTSA